MENHKIANNLATTEAREKNASKLGILTMFEMF